VIGAYYYLRVIWYMFFEAGTDVPAVDRQPLVRGALAINCFALLALGALPGALLTLCANLIP
jgi:NADH-quinone oxidoreductase subunit N